ncbi:MAG: beta-N-acetylhexosaminidase [Chitinophagaceae bacterium]|nr:beta-N-acetylhexosaminidase [Chitinophagaceae bacterium]
MLKKHIVTNYKNKKRDYRLYNLIISFLAICFSHTSLITQAGGIADPKLHVIPYPQQVTVSGNDFILSNSLDIVLSKNHSADDAFTAEELARDLKAEWNIEAAIGTKKKKHAILLVRNKKSRAIRAQGYELVVTPEGITIEAPDEQGLFYGTQTLLQLIHKGDTDLRITGLTIKDWPTIAKRAVHYDTKHHQDKISYVRDFIKELARYKINMLVWEWEDKFAYPSHPEIGAPGAFTPEEIKGLTKYARNYHIEIVPLVQGLGHVSFILKWPQFSAWREIAASNWQFCPLKQGSYDLLFDLWKDAMDATEGSSYFHIGSDEAYELGHCENCQAKTKEIGKRGLYHIFEDKVSRFIVSKGRTPIIWESLRLVKEGENKRFMPNKKAVLTEDMGEAGIEQARRAKDLGYKVFFFDPNPGIEPVFLPYFYSESEDGQIQKGCLEKSYTLLKQAASSGAFDGFIRTSWDDAGLHNQQWMLSFLTLAEYSWNSEGTDLEQFKKNFFNNYYGTTSVNMEELFNLLNEASYYYWDTFERKVWHFGEVGKTFLPDLPRGDIIEYDPYWNTAHKAMVERSYAMQKKMDRVLAIIAANQAQQIKHMYDLDIYETMARLVHHTCQTYIDLSSLEKAIAAAHMQAFRNRDSAGYYLQKAQDIIIHNLQRRKIVLNNIVEVWEKTRLPKGMSTAEKKYFFRQDKARHFANRKPDMSYFIYDEQQLDLEGYLEKLKLYAEKFRNDSF